MKLDVETINILIEMYPGKFVSDGYRCVQIGRRLVLFYRGITDEYDTIAPSVFMKQVDDMDVKLLKLVLR